MYSWIQDMLLRVLWGGLSQFEFLRGFSSGSNLTVNWGKRVPTNGKSNSNAKIYAAMEPKLQLLPRQRRNKKKKIEKIVFLAVGKKLTAAIFDNGTCFWTSWSPVLGAILVPKPSLPTLGSWRSSWFQINLWSGCGLPALYLRFRYFLEVNGTQIVSNDEIVSPENGAICSGMRVLLFCGSTSVGQVPPLVIREYFAIWLGP